MLEETSALNPAFPVGRLITDVETTPFMPLNLSPHIGPEAMLTEALAFVQAHKTVPTTMLAEAASAVRTLEKVLGTTADLIPAAPKDLTPLIEGAFPGRLRINIKRWSNIKWAIRRLLRECGLHAPPSSENKYLTPAWSALISALSTKHDRVYMRGFAAWCSDAGIEPDQVTEVTLQNYCHYREVYTIRTGMTKLQSRIRQNWNRAVRARVPGWPMRMLQAEGNQQIEALPVGSFPASFQIELAAYLAKCALPDPFDAEHAQWRPTTVSKVRAFLIRAASLVARRRGGIEHVCCLADIVTVDNVEFVLRHMYERAGNVWRGHMMNFATYLLVLARDFVHTDSATIARLQQIRDVIVTRVREQRNPGLSEKVGHRIRPFDDPRLLRRFFMLPGDLYRGAHALLDGSPVRAAQMHEQALMLDLLQHDPMRCFSLASINYKTDFISEGGRIVRLWIPGHRTKNGIEIYTPIPLELERHIRAHLATYRPHLRGASSDWLFPSPRGSHRAPDNVSATLGRAVRKALGVQFTAHLMRHIVATLLYRRDPNNGVVVQRKLRHSSIKITERMYGAMSNASANAAWQRELESYRRTNVRRKTSGQRRR
jgi:integrase